MRIAERTQTSVTYSLVLVLEISPLIMIITTYPTEIGAESPPAVIDPRVTISQKIPRSKFPANLNFEKRTRDIIAIHAGTIMPDRITDRCIKAGATNEMMVTKMRVAIIVPSDDM